MAKVEKVLSQMRDNPSGWRLEEVGRILEAHGFRLKNQRGSDRIYKHDQTGARVFLSYHGSGPVYAGYVRRVIAAIDQLGSQS
jgi:predicted RNA binding protein YcfA (HicA-like mRNA interferase family)